MIDVSNILSIFGRNVIKDEAAVTTDAVLLFRDITRQLITRDSEVNRLT